MITSMWTEFTAMFRKPSVAQLIIAELEDAERSLLKAHTAHEHAAVGITFEQTRIKRLRAALRDNTKHSGEMK
jgi:hypothetical protein